MENPPYSPPPLAPKKPFMGRIILPPIQPKRLFTQRKKRVNIRYNPKNPKNVKRVSDLKGRLNDNPEMRIEKYINTNGYSHIVFDGDPNNVRNILGTNDPPIESTNEGFMTAYRKSTLQPTYPTRRFARPTLKKEMPLRNSLLRKSFTNTQKNLSARYQKEHIMPQRLNF